MYWSAFVTLVLFLCACIPKGVIPDFEQKENFKLIATLICYALIMFLH